MSLAGFGCSLLVLGVLVGFGGLGRVLVFLAGFGCSRPVFGVLGCF